MFNTEMTKKIIDCQKNTFNSVYGAMTKMQDQMEATTTDVLKHMPYLPGEGIKAIDSWVGAVKNGQAEFKKMVDKGFETAKTFVVDPMETVKKK